LGNHSSPYFLKKNQYDNIGHLLVLILIKKEEKLKYLEKLSFKIVLSRMTFKPNSTLQTDLVK